MAPKGPALRQFIGLGVTLAVVALFSLYTQRQISGLRRLQTESIDRNRRDSLQLVRIQNDLNQIGLALRDMQQRDAGYPLSSWRAQLERIRLDLDDAIRTEAQLAPSSRPAAQTELLASVFRRFWGELDHLWQLTSQGREDDARRLISTRIDSERATLTTLAARLLVQNEDNERAATLEVEQIYGRVERNLYLLLAAVLAAIVVTSLSVIEFNRRLFRRLEQVGEQRRLLAAKLIDVQEEIFRKLGRELHDEFGQVLTAMGAMLARVEKRLPAESPSREGIHEVRQIANETLERVRGMSQMLHPPVLDDYGLEKSIEWYAARFSNQTGMSVNYEKIGSGPWIGDEIAIHVYRILQEALSNAFKHSGVREVKVSAHYTPRTLELLVEDHGGGLPSPLPSAGIGMIAMRERADIIGGEISYEQPTGGGTRVRLQVPLGAKENEAA